MTDNQSKMLLSIFGIFVVGMSTIILLLGLLVYNYVNKEIRYVWIHKAPGIIFEPLPASTTTPCEAS